MELSKHMQERKGEHIKLLLQCTKQELKLGIQLESSSAFGLIPYGGEASIVRRY